MECGGGRMNEVEKFKSDMDKLSIQEVKNILNNMIRFDADPEFVQACKEVINERRNARIYDV